jgi:regulator of RNase E activity RraA
MIDATNVSDLSRRTELEHLRVATLHQASSRAGLITSTRILSGSSFASRAATLTIIPASDNLGLQWLLEDGPRGAVLYIASRGKDGGRRCAAEILHPVLAPCASPKVIDDSVSDAAQLDAIGLPPARRRLRAQGAIKQRDVDPRQCVTLGAAAVSARDSFVGDRDGLLALTNSRIEEENAHGRECVSGRDSPWGSA